MTTKIDVLFMNLHRRYLDLEVKYGGFLGIYCLSAYLRKKGYEAKGFSGTLKDGKNVLDEFCSKENISMLGLYCDYDNVTENAFISRYIKENYHIPVIVGGPQASELDGTFFAKSKCDAVVIGEGELTVYDLARHFIDGAGKLGNISGIVYHDSPDLVKNSERPLINNLDELPFITESCYLEPVYFHQNFTIMTGRGCPFHCAFCHEGIGKAVRFRSVENIMAEIDEYLKGWDGEDLCINFTDDTFTLNPARVKRICEGIKLRRENHRSIKFFCEGHVHTLYKNPKMIQCLAESGCYRLQLGIEAGTDEVLKAYGKNTTPEEILKVVQLCCDFGIKQIYGNIILGGAFFNRNIFEADKEFAKKLLNIGKGVIELGVLTFWPLPNTKMTMHPESFGIQIFDREFLTSLGDFPQTETLDCDRLTIAEKQSELETTIEEEMKYILESGQIPTATVLGWFRQSQIRYPGAWFILLKQIEYLYNYYEMIYLGEGIESKNLTDIENARPMRIACLYRCLKRISEKTVMVFGEKFTDREWDIVTFATGKLTVREISERVGLQIPKVIEVLHRLEKKHFIVYALY